MNKILIILGREYFVRVKKKSFLVLTLLGPLIFATMVIAPIWLATSDTDRQIKEILVSDDSGLLSERLEDTDFLHFIIQDSLTIEQVKSLVLSQAFYGAIHIDRDLKQSTFYSTDKPSLMTETSIRNLFNRKLKTLRINQLGLSAAQVSFLRSPLEMKTILIGDKGSEDQVSTAITSGIAYISAMLIYIFIIFYASQVMRGVAEEKNNRIVEVMILSVKPFQLMIGKIIGIAAVGLTQLGLWIVLTIVIVTSGLSIISPSIIADSQSQSTIMNTLATEESSVAVGNALKIIASLDITTLVISFLFYFVSGYLLYAALFAAIGSAVGQDSDSQQYSVLVTFPLILSLMLSGAVLNNPTGDVAIWASIIPFSSPVIMLTRLPFGVPPLELIMSILTMLATIVGVIWMAGRIYRVGILANNSKISLKIMGQWLMQK